MGVILTYTRPQLEIFFGDVKRFNTVAKGRRFGATRGASHACIEWAIDGDPILWGDTVHGNIVRYIDRYFKPALIKNEAAMREVGIEWEWRAQDKVLKIGEGFIDFRSADRPENWEGFGYKKIVLNEAGIILQDAYLYSNAVLPMMMDFPEAKLFALGVPKGKFLRDGSEHPFYKLFKSDSPQHRSMTFSTYDNKLLAEEDIDLTKKEIGAMSPEEVDQEIYGAFLDRSGDTPFAHAFEPSKIVKACELDHRQPVIFAIDFNVEPFCAIVAQVRKADAEVVITHEIVCRTGTISEMAQRMLSLCPQAYNMIITGDRTGAARRIGRTSTASLWDDLMDELRLRDSQLKLPGNPSHIESREQVNYILHHHPSFTISPRCDGLINDLKVVQYSNMDKEIVKADRSKQSQKADLLDGLRYLCNTFLYKWIQTHRKTHALQRPSNGTTVKAVR